MSFKTKVVAFLAGSALALSVATGAMAQDDTTSASATLGPNTTDGACSIAFTVTDEVTSTLDLGDFEWNGSGYTFKTGSASPATATATQTISNSSETCYVTVQLAGDLTNGNDTIGADDVTLSINSGGSSDVAVSVPTGAVGAAVSVSGTIDTGAVTSDLATGEYSATLNLDVSDSAG